MEIKERKDRERLEKRGGGGDLKNGRYNKGNLGVGGACKPEGGDQNKETDGEENE